MNERAPLSERERADLVAYLDGELKGDAARKVETRIAREPAVRAEAAALRRAWDMLDFLPMPEPSDQFMHRTVEKAAPVTATLAAPPRLQRHWLRPVAMVSWAAAVVFALAAGYSATRMSAPREPGDPELVRDLFVIENKRAYEASDDLDFVRELDAPELFGDDSVGT
jgi:anti-sigma factor RsiW